MLYLDNFVHGFTDEHGLVVGEDADEDHPNDGEP